MTNETVAQQPTRVSLISAMAAKYQIEPAKFLSTMKATVFDSKASDEEMIAFLAVANKYELDPFRKEVFAFRKSGEGGGIQPLVSVDGWSSIANRQPSYDGVDFEDKLDGDKLVSITCRIHRKDRSRPTEVTEYLSECKRNTMPWNQWPGRMLRHKAFIQCVRLAFGISGIMDPDEVERMVEAQVRALPAAELATTPVVEAAPKSISDLKERAKKLNTKAEQVPATEAAIPPSSSAGQPAPAAATSKLPGYIQAINSYKSMLDEEMFAGFLKKHGADPKAADYGLGTDGLKALLDECGKAMGA